MFFDFSINTRYFENFVYYYKQAIIDRVGFRKIR